MARFCFLFFEFVPRLFGGLKGKVYPLFQVVSSCAIVPRSSSRGWFEQVGTNFFLDVYFSRGTLPTKKGVRKGTSGEPRGGWMFLFFGVGTPSFWWFKGKLKRNTMLAGGSPILRHPQLGTWRLIWLRGYLKNGDRFGTSGKSAITMALTHNSRGYKYPNCWDITRLANHLLGTL